MKESFYLLVVLFSWATTAWCGSEIEFCKVTDVTKSSKPFEFKIVETGQTAAGHFEPASLIPISDLTGIWLTSREISAVPITGMLIGFKEGALNKLKKLKFQNGEILVLLDNKALATIGVSDLIDIISQKEKAFVTTSSYSKDDLIEKTKAINRRIDSLTQ